MTAQATGRPAAVLVGPMGAGKSTVGRALAHALGVAFCDTDDELERRSGRSIPDIFAADGEPAFRRLESEVVTDVLGRFDGVVSLGGGAVMTDTIREALAGHAVVYLRVGADTGFARVAASDRPLLADPDPRRRYADLLSRREPTYRAVAAVEVDAARNPQTVVDDIRARLQAVRADQ
ncbi:MULTISPECIES: shikimate kinase [Gordonia]|uniref:Shikimate kinase n=1 Tax=Gordonia cholesterolivorans TaxID=559625 RepID=A0ABN3HJS8_9ACTN|nr:shikimate kinase [Gordonia sihwensis]KJR03809.1 shikimate kinase [Gordonia sihwensis]